MGEERTDGMKIEKLNGSNYQSWKFNVKLVLMQKELFGIIDGTDIAPREDDTDAIKRKWKIRSDKAYSLIALSLETSLQIHVVGTTYAKEAWDIIEKQYSFVSLTQLVRLT